VRHRPAGTLVDITDTHPRLRNCVLVFRREDLLQFVSLSDLRVKEFRATDAVIELMPLLDGTRSVAELRAAFAVSTQDDVRIVDECLELLRSERLLGRGEKWTGDPRYARQGLLFEEFIATFEHLPASARQLQDRLGDARVVVVGIGGVGSWALHCLALAGVGQLDIVDPDVVDVSNLNRQALYSTADVGVAKVTAAAARIAEVNDGPVLTGHRRSVRSASDLTDILESADLVISCGDDPDPFTLSDVVADSAHAAGTPHIVGGAYGGNIGSPGVTVIPGESTCWRCIRDATRDDHARASMSTVKGRTGAGGSIAPVAGMVGSMTAWEALRILLDLPLALANHVRELDIMSLEWRIRPVEGRRDCVFCGPSAASSG
jgi:molybdopterin/thiamine biosynthesis adenylyltransferase